MSGLLNPVNENDTVSFETRDDGKGLSGVKVKIMK